jgi:hypothetical protein
MTLSERVAELKGGRLVVRRVRLPVSLKLESSYDRVSARFDQVSPVKAADYEALLEKLVDLEKSGDLSKLSSVRCGFPPVACLTARRGWQITESS